MSIQSLLSDQPREVVCAIDQKEAEEYKVHLEGDQWIEAGKDWEYVISLGDAYFAMESAGQIEYLQERMVEVFKTL